MASAYRIVFVTAPSAAEAERMARILVREKFAACVSCVPSVRSFYRWKGKLETSRETLLILKTVKSRIPALVKKIQSVHSYSIPEIVAFPIVQGSSSYLKWLEDSLR